MVFSINFLFSSNYLVTISSTDYLNVFLSIAQNPHTPLAFIVAVLGDPYNNANSPKPSPAFSVLFIWLLITTSQLPFSIIKYVDA